MQPFGLGQSGEEVLPKAEDDVQVKINSEDVYVASNRVAR